jgi:hypothetical protein
LPPRWKTDIAGADGGIGGFFSPGDSDNIFGRNLNAS